LADKPDILHRQNEYNFNIWYDTEDPIFSEISTKSRLTQRWVRYEEVLKGKYKNSLIKPINHYVEGLYPPPVLMSIDDDIVTLQQRNHAEFFLLETGDRFKSIDRPWMRQYYKTKEQFRYDDCFPRTFVFYTPWIIDEDVEVFYTRPEESPFFIQERSFLRNRIDPLSMYVEPNFVPFNFKRVGTHMVDDKYGKIKRNQPMFNISFKADDIMMKRVKEFYEQD
jgi:hypothetical protein